LGGALFLETRQRQINFLLFPKQVVQPVLCFCRDSQSLEPSHIAPVSNTLVVEDDANILNLLSAYLESAGHKVVAASDGDTGLQKALNQTFDICVFDEMLPHRSGSDMRTAGIETPILFLSALSTEADVIRGFKAGGDDYVVKPFSPRELLVRVDAILRRSSSNASNRNRGDDLIKLADDQPTCVVGGTPIELTPHEYRILRQLLSQPNRVFARGSLIATLYGNEHAVSPKAIDVHVHHLRAKLGSEVGALIKTVRGFGYRYAPNVSAPRVTDSV
jgi:DNA-binding response OmpR family regulator